MGLSGSGKSTLVALLQRLYDPTGGQVRAVTASLGHGVLVLVCCGMLGPQPAHCAEQGICWWEQSDLNPLRDEIWQLQKQLLGCRCSLMGLHWTKLTRSGTAARSGLCPRTPACSPPLWPPTSRMAAPTEHRRADCLIVHRGQAAASWVSSVPTDSTWRHALGLQVRTLPIPSVSDRRRHTTCLLLTNVAAMISFGHLDRSE